MAAAKACLVLHFMVKTEEEVQLATFFTEIFHKHTYELYIEHFIPFLCVIGDSY
jgi:hypothetical protein